MANDLTTTYTNPSSEVNRSRLALMDWGLAWSLAIGEAAAAQKSRQLQNIRFPKNVVSGYTWRVSN